MHEADAQAGPEHRQLTIAFCLRLVTVGVLLVAAFWVFYLTRGGQKLTLEQMYLSALRLKSQVHSNYWQSVLIFLLAYIVLATWLPATGILTLCAGFLFGTLHGIFCVLAAAVVTALITFYTGRYLIGGWIQHRWKYRLRAFNENLARFGAEYLIIIRLIPMMPFSLVNTLAGITRIPAGVFAWTTVVGILPGVIIFSYLGRNLPEMASVNDLWSWKVILILLAMRLTLFLVVLARFSLLKRNLISVSRPAAGS